MPAGEYKPVLEDDYGYYYQAPSKVAVRFPLAASAVDGGVVIKRGETKPSKWYITDSANGNTIKKGGLPDNLQAHVIEN